MDYSSFLEMKPELSLVAVMVLLLIYDLFSGKKGMRYFQSIACILLLFQTFFSLMPVSGGDVVILEGMYQSSSMANILKAILTIGTLIVFLQSRKWLESEECFVRRGEFYFLTLSTLLGMFFMISAGNFLLFYLGLETASIPMAALVAFNKYKHKSAEAGAKYILNAAFASGLSLYGLSLLYGTTGTLYFNDMPAMLTGTPLQVMAMIFFLVGLFFKISLVPFHLWTPDVYEGAPTSVTGYLSVISKGAGAFALMAILFKVFAPMVAQWTFILYVLIVLTITVANLFAIRQQNLKRFLAYSSVSQAGYIMLGVISGNGLGMTALVYYVLVYLVSNLAAFGVIAAVENKSGKVTMNDYNGFYQTNPKLSFVMMIALFSLAGIPPFAGFFSKFFIFVSAIQSGFYVLVFIALLNTIISLYYYLLVVKAMFINKNDAPVEKFRSDNSMRLSLLVCGAGIILLGVLSVVYDQLSYFGFGM